MGIFQKWFGREPALDLKNIIDGGAFLVDVRTPGEFAGGHVSKSVNIPLDVLHTQLAQFKNKKDIVVFCRSGNRSSQAKIILEKNGFTNVINGRTWTQVNRLVK